MKKPFIALFCIALSVYGSYKGQPYVRGNTDAVTIIVTFISVFAAILITIMTLIGDPSLAPRGSWRKVSRRHANLELALIRYSYLFRCYLVTVALLLMGVLIEKAPQCSVAETSKSYVEHAYMFFTVLSFLLTLGLPESLARIQLQRSSAGVEERREIEGIENDATE